MVSPRLTSTEKIKVRVVWYEPEKHIIFLFLVESPDRCGAFMAVEGGVVARILKCVMESIGTG